jgi:hypothetical protein
MPHVSLCLTLDQILHIIYVIDYFCFEFESVLKKKSLIIFLFVFIKLFMCMRKISKVIRRIINEKILKLHAIC